MIFCIIDDERDVCDLLRLFFEARGYRCLVAHDGVTGLELVQKEKPSAVFLDVAMPRMNGFEVLAKIRGDENIKETPVLLMTALTKDADLSPREWTQRTGADAFLAKPFELAELMQVVEQLTGIKA